MHCFLVVHGTYDTIMGFWKSITYTGYIQCPAGLWSREPYREICCWKETVLLSKRLWVFSEQFAVGYMLLSLEDLWIPPFELQSKNKKGARWLTCHHYGGNLRVRQLFVRVRTYFPLHHHLHFALLGINCCWNLLLYLIFSKCVSYVCLIWNWQQGNNYW